MRQHAQRSIDDSTDQHDERRIKGGAIIQEITDERYPYMRKWRVGKPDQKIREREIECEASGS